MLNHIVAGHPIKVGFDLHNGCLVDYVGAEDYNDFEIKKFRDTWITLKEGEELTYTGKMIQSPTNPKVVYCLCQTKYRKMWLSVRNTYNKSVSNEKLRK